MKKLLKWIGVSLATLVAIALVGLATIIFVGGRKLSAERTLAPEIVGSVSVPVDAASIERGAHLAATRCVFCHGEDLGGKKFIDDASFMLLNAPNLTRGGGGVGAHYADDTAWVRSIRHGLNPQGRALIIMPSEVFYYLSDEDLGSLVAYLKSLPPIDRSWAAPQPAIVAKALVGAGVLTSAVPFLGMDHQAPRPAAPAPGATAEYGEYIARSFGCASCHGKELSGQLTPGPKKFLAGNLTPGGPLKDWNEELFLKMVHERVHEEMPWGMLRSMHDLEQRALWRFLAAQPARASTGVAGES
ncbi:MAG: cytochrome c [Thermoanaerobaculia bacterium]